MVLKRHKIFIFGWTVPLRQINTPQCLCLRGCVFMVTLNCCLHQATIFHPSHNSDKSKIHSWLLTQQSVAVILSSNFIWKLRNNIRIHTEWKMSLSLRHAIGYVQTEVKSWRSLYFTMDKPMCLEWWMNYSQTNKLWN